MDAEKTIQKSNIEDTISAHCPAPQQNGASLSGSSEQVVEEEGGLERNHSLDQSGLNVSKEAAKRKKVRFRFPYEDVSKLDVNHQGLALQLVEANIQERCTGSGEVSYDKLFTVSFSGSSDSRSKKRNTFISTNSQYYRSSNFMSLT